MADNQANEPQVLDNVWANAEDANVDADCSPTKVCRNARDFTFDGINDGEDDLATSWRKLLKAEGKLADTGTPVRDLVLGQSATASNNSSTNNSND